MTFKRQTARLQRKQLKQNVGLCERVKEIPLTDKNYATCAEIVLIYLLGALSIALLNGRWCVGSVGMMSVVVWSTVIKVTPITVTAVYGKIARKDEDNLKSCITCINLINENFMKAVFTSC